MNPWQRRSENEGYSFRLNILCYFIIVCTDDCIDI